MKRFGARILAAAVAGSLIVTPAMAAPSINDLKEDKAEKQSEVNSLQKELTDIMMKLGDLEEGLIKKGEEITQAEADLTVAEEKEKEQYEAMKLRIKYMYEEGSSTALESLVSAEDFTDLVNKAEYVQKVHKYDRDQLQEYVETKQEIADLKTTLEEDQKAMEGLQVEYEAKETQLNDTIESKRAEVADLDAQIQAAAEAAARAAEEQRRREEEARRAAENNNTSGNQGNNSGSSSNTNNSSNDNGAADSGSSNNVSNDNASASLGNTGSSVESAGNNTGNANTGSSNTGSTESTGSSSTGSGLDYAGSGDSSVAQTIVNAAYSQLGVPYVWGGTSPGSGLDCSGLTQYCHRVAGISIGRTSEVQGGGGKAVSNPQPGDLVCYGSHIGIYIGGGQMIHAPHTGDVVRVASVYGSPWYRRYW